MTEARYQVLIVDDAPEDRYVVRRHLAKNADEQYSFFEASTGAEALQVLQEQRIDCIIIDYNLPDMTGVDFLANIDETLIRSTGLIFLTGSGNESIAVEAMKQGAQDYLTKSNLQQDHLQTAVHHAVEKATLLHTLQEQQQALEISEGRFRSVVENMLDSFAIMSPIRHNEEITDFRLDYLNAAAYKNMMIPTDGIIGASMSELWPVFHQGSFFDELVKVIKTGVSVTINNFHYVTKDREEWYDLQLTKFAGGLTATWRNVTERRQAERERQYLLEQEQATRKALEETQERLVFLLEASSIMVFEQEYADSLGELAELVVQKLADLCLIDMLKSDGTMQRIAAAQRASIPQDQAIGNPPNINEDRAKDHLFWEIFYSGQAQLLTNSNKLLMLHPCFQRSQSQQDTALEPCESLMLVPLIARGQKIGMLWLIRVEGEAAFNMLDLELAQELAQRIAISIDINRLYQEAQKAIQVRDSFLSIASHELKNPLTVLRGQAALMLRRAERNNLGERDIRSVDAIHNQALRMDMLIDTLLNVSRLQSGTIEIKRDQIDLSNLIQQVIRGLRPTYTKHTLVSELPKEPVWVIGDAFRLEQVLTNLLNNAVKYSPDNPQIKITLTTTAKTAQIRIIDRGIGIPADALPYLFQRDYRVKNEQTSGIAGMGIGLYVVHELVQIHDGKVSVESVEGQGSTFIIELPLAPSKG